MIAHMRNWLTVVAVVVAVLGIANFFAQVVPLYISHPLSIAAIGYVLVVQVFPRAVLRAADPPPPLAGPPLVARRCSGRIGAIDIRNMMWVTVYADRIVVRVMLLGTRTIMADEIISVSEESLLAHGATGIRITHSAAGLVSPVVIAVDAFDPLRFTIEGLRRGSQPATADETRPQDGVSRLMRIGAIVSVVVFVGFGVVMMIRGNHFGLIFVGAALLFGYQVVLNR